MSSTVFVAGSRLNCNRRSSLSADAQIVWDALVKKHEQRIKTQNTHCKPDRCTYYKTLNQHSFGASLPNTNGTSRPDTNGTSLPDTNGICASEFMSQKNNYKGTKWNWTCPPSQCSSVDGIIYLPNTTVQNTYNDMSSSAVAESNSLHYHHMMLETPDKLTDFDSGTSVKSYPQSDRINQRSSLSSHGLIESFRSASVGRSTQFQQGLLHGSRTFAADVEDSYLCYDKEHSISTPPAYGRHYMGTADSLPQSSDDESVSFSGCSWIKTSNKCWKPFTHAQVPEPLPSESYKSRDLCTRLPQQNITLQHDFVDSDFEQGNRSKYGTLGTAQKQSYVSEIFEEQQQQQKTECNSQPLFPHSQPRMATWDEGAGNAEATFSLAYLSQFTNTQSYSPPLDLSPESDLDRVEHSQSMKTAEMKTVSPQHSDISTVTHHSPSVTTKSVFCHSTSNDTVTMMTHSDKFDGPDRCGSSESVVLDTSVGRGSYEPVCFPHKGGCNAGSGLREQQNRELFKKPIGGKSTQHVGHIDSDSIAPPRGTLAQSSLKKVTKRKASSETSADVDLRTLEYFLENAGKPREKKTNKYAYSTPVKRTKTNDLTSLAGNVKSSRREGEHSLLWPVDELSDNARDRLVESLRQAHEIALSLVYTNGSTQLREQTENKRKSIIEDKVAGVAFAYPKCTNPVCVDFGDCSNIVLQFAYVPLNSQNSAYAWSRAVLEELMSVSRTRKLCFDGQELIQNLILHFGYSHSTVSTKWRVLDVKIASWLLDSDNPAVTFTEVIDHYPEVKQMRTDSSNGKDIICGDLKLLGPITTKLYQQLQNAALWELFEKIEMPLCPLLAVMELRGISIDTSVMIKSGYVLKKKLGELEKEIYSAAGRPFVITSHPQLRQILFEELKLDSRLPPNKHVVRTLVKQQKSTSEAVLTVLQDVHPLPALILQYRQVQKLKSTYVDSLLGFVKGAQLHTHWDHTAAATGRLTSTDPNIQAIPKVPLQITPVKETGEELTGTGKRFSDGQAVSVSVYAREPFISQQGYSLLSADFKQIELRLLAHLSGDSALLRVFNNPNSDDIFKDLTSQWLGKNRRDVTEKEREQTKRVVYSVMYGAGKERLAEYLKISPDEAKCIMNSFLVMFPGVNRFTRKCIEEAREKGYQETIFRRRRQLPHIHHWRAPLRAQCERQAVNFCVQGSSADLCKAAMLQVEEALATRPHCRLLVQIHDELLLEVPDTEIDTVAEIVRTIMQSGDGLCRNFTKLRVPLKVSIHMGKSWAHMNTWASLGHT